MILISNTTVVVAQFRHQTLLLRQFFASAQQVDVGPDAAAATHADGKGLEEEEEEQ